MKLYLIHRDDEVGWDNYESAVVAAYNKDQAVKIHPDEEQVWNEITNQWPKMENKYYYPNWVEHFNEVKVKYLGIASSQIKKSVVHSSFRNG